MVPAKPHRRGSGSHRPERCSPSDSNWSYTASRDVNPLKRPGVMRLWSWQAMAHGADAVLFFQMRASRGACEKYHGAVIGRQ